MTGHYAFLKAAGMAAIAHEGQIDKAGRPYMVHVENVVDMLKKQGEGYIVLTVAYLHDIVEDTPITLDQILVEFGPEVTEAVAALTKRANENYAQYLERVLANKIATVVKRADIKEHLIDPTPLKFEKVVQYTRALEYLG